MITSDMVIQLCEKLNVSITELSRRIGQTSQNFNKKLKRNTVSLDELMAIADALGVTFEQKFVISKHEVIQISNRENL